MKNYVETSLVNNAITRFHDLNFGIDEVGCVEMTISFMETYARYLSSVKKKDKTMGYKILNKLDNDKFIMGCYVTFIPMEEDATKGSYNLIFTFDEADMEDVEIDNNANMMINHIISDIANRNFGINLAYGQEKDIVNVMEVILFEEIKLYLQANAQFDPELKLEYKGDEIFEAGITKDDNGETYYLIPSAMIKQYVKDDSALEYK